jgi:hypothetical protein
MGTNFYWNTEDAEVLETIETIGKWRAPLRAGYGEPAKPEAIDELRALGVPEGVLENMANPSPPTLNDFSHIGKRSAAGLYCYSCNAWFHDPANCDERPKDERTSCKYCGAQAKSGMNRATSVELGFAKPEPLRPESGVEGTCAFLWANWPDEVYHIARQAPAEMQLVVDEYGKTMTGKEFVNMLRASVSISKLSIGHIFS